MMKTRYLLALLCVISPLTQAEIYKAVDENGHVTYSNAPLKGGKKIISSQHGDGQKRSSKVSAARGNPSPNNFPKIDNETQRNRDGTRQKILQHELESEEKLLIDARKSLRDTETNRTDPKYDDKMKALAAEVKVHEKNIEALNTELSKLR